MTTAKNREKPITNLYSIRWRLLLSYAGIALLAALALGGLLLFTLRSYYDQRERDYMHASADIVKRSAELLLRDDPPEDVLQGAVDIYAFVGLARVRLLDVDQQMIVDSGSVAGWNTVNLEYRKSQNFDSVPLPTDIVIGGWPGSRPGGLDGDFSVYGEVVVEEGTYLFIQQGEFTPPEGEREQPAWQRYPLMSRRGALDQILTGETSQGSHTNVVVTVPLMDRHTGEVLGYLEMSEGPAFGTEIVNDVAERAVVAGLIAVLLAGVAGWFTSRRISQPVLALAENTARMAEGDLSVRADVDRRDELGLLARTFNTMAERVENTVVTLKRFVADAAHEINTPITALRTNLELAAASDHPDEFRADIAHAQTELTRLETLTRGLLALARIEAQDEKPARTTVDLTALTQQMHERYASRAEQNGVDLVLEAPPTPVATQADAAQFSRLFENLLDNALKFTLHDGTVTLGLDADAQSILLWVSDTGIGIPPDEMPRLFNRFHRASNVASYPGNGLGLVIT
ncbi:MAG: HAMP domain-containing histidine kinase, partial [Anaerolineae bacterium]|nr:HAMP domain-containing histidine kinase [Anaerolineae bacterium]